MNSTSLNSIHRIACIKRADAVSSGMGGGGGWTGRTGKDGGKSPACDEIAGSYCSRQPPGGIEEVTTTAQRNRPFILDVGEQQFLANIGRVAAPSLVGGGAGGGVDGEGKDSEEKRELDSCEKSTLEPYIPKEDLDSAVLHDGKVPFYLANRFDAITRGNHIYVRPNAYDPSVPAGLALLGHELEHVGQYRGGMTVFSYWQSTLGPDGYDGSPYEIAAYATQLRIGNDLTKNGFAGCPQGAGK